MNASGARDLTIRHQLPHRLRLDCSQELTPPRLELISGAMKQAHPELAVRATSHRRGLVITSQPDQLVCPALVASLLQATLAASDLHGPATPPTPLDRWLDHTRQGSIKVLMALAIAGWMLPVLPGTPFFLLAWWLGWRPQPEAPSSEAQLKPAALQPGP